MARNQMNPPPSAEDRLIGPLTFFQRKIWLIDQMREAAATTESHIVQLRFSGTVQSGLLHSALKILIRRHSILRTTFHSDGADPYQRIWPAPTRLFIAKIDLGGNTPTAVERNIKDLMAEEARKPFNLAQGPLGRCVLIRRSDGDSEIVLTLHRIIVDDTSIDILADDLMALYSAKLERRPLPRKSTKTQYMDAAIQEWQRSGGAAVHDRLDFWKTHLDGAHFRAATERDSPATVDSRSVIRRTRISINEAVVNSLNRATEKYGVPAYVPLIAAWAVLLSKTRADSSVVMGLQLPRRRSSDLDSVVGPLDDVLPLHVRDCDTASVAHLIAEIDNAISAISEMPYTPSEWILDNTEGRLSVELLNRARVRVQTPENGRPRGSDLWLRSQQPPEFHSPFFEIALNILCVGQTTSAELVYATNRFSDQSAKRLAARFARVLAGMLGDGQKAAGSLPLLSSKEYRQIIFGLNAQNFLSPRSGKPQLRGMLLHNLFEKWARRRPDDVALICQKKSTTYRDLNARANKLAHYLRALGIALEDRVAICMERSEEMIVAMLGVLKSGGAYVPLDPGLPISRLHRILKDSGAVTMIAPRSFAAVCKSASLPLIDLRQSAHRAAISESPEHNPRPSATGIRPSNLAYVIYTSGSTGQPKGVLIEHASVVSSTLARNRYYGPMGRSLLISPISFDSSVAVVYGALAGGGTLVIATEATVRDSGKLARKIVSDDVELLLTVPDLLRQILDELRHLRGIPPTLRLIVAGDVCPRSIVETARSMALPLFNEYGPTEGTVWATVHDCTELTSRVSVPIGRPIDTAKIYILDPHLTPTPIGSIGEIHIGGDGVARGYMNLLAPTNERFIKDPFDRTDAGRMYKTGDLGRWLPTGHIEFCGRRDSQVKVRGYRIELEEIESRLTDIEGIDAAAVAWENSNANPHRLIAYVVCKDPDGFRPTSIHELLSRELPAYMVPSAYVHLETLPLTPNGKIDRASLPKAAARSVARNEYSEPRGEKEAHLAAMWTKLLGVSRIGRRDNFFQLGGDSLSAAKLVDLCKKDGWRVTVHDLFRSPTLVDFARRLRAAR